MKSGRVYSDKISIFLYDPGIMFQVVDFAKCSIRSCPPGACRSSRQLVAITNCHLATYFSTKSRVSRKHKKNMSPSR